MGDPHTNVEDRRLDNPEGIFTSESRPKADGGALRHIIASRAPETKYLIPLRGSGSPLLDLARSGEAFLYVCASAFGAPIYPREAS